MLSNYGRNKAVALAANLVPEGTLGTAIMAFPYHFQDAVALGFDLSADLVVCGPDQDEARLAVAEHYLGDTPVVFLGLDQEANGGYVFVQEQESGAACFRCFRPDAGGGGACPATPATLDPAKIAAGLALGAVDSILMGRHRAWDVYEFTLAGVLPPSVRTVDRRDDCSLCGGGS